MIGKVCVVSVSKMMEVSKVQLTRRARIQVRYVHKTRGNTVLQNGVFHPLKNSIFRNVLRFVALMFKKTNNAEKIFFLVRKYAKVNIFSFSSKFYYIEICIAAICNVLCSWSDFTGDKKNETSSTEKISELKMHEQ